ncbi:hypothetical protein GCM10009678_71410 [Actinomadura kijaniata]|uniref:ABC-type transporter Mla subunit MlaD n=1 Tax=Actinomadura namibiensis TaxID=182080 RepID=A0A7W3LWN6_ACTNM|nr:DUF5955 family protein [Actinomadura namibiensis]MBA8955575.1 ABC-type transporter Mla subunit MlaD [Actinomadura namibiensis]
MSQNDDYRINITGNVSGQVGSGRNVHQTQNVGAARADEVTAALDRLEDLLRRHADRLAEADRATRDVEALRRELQEPDPDPEALRDTTGRLARRVAGVTVLVEAVNGLTALLGLGG